MTQQEQARLQVLNSLLTGHMTTEQAATLMGVSTRHTRRILAAYRRDGVAAIAHANRGRRPANATAETMATHVVDLARTRYAGVNHTHLSELLRDREGIEIGRSTLSLNPPKDTDGRREDSGRGVRELQGRWPGLHWGRWEVGGRSSVAAQGPYGRLRELRCAGWRENTQQGTLADRGGASLRGRWVSRRLAVRPGVEWLAAGPRRE